MSSSAPSPLDQKALQENQQQTDSASENKTPLPLSLPEPTTTTTATAAAADADTTQVSVGGDAVKLHHLGPLVVNKDGTLSRIANWQHMAEIEKQNTLRILGKRNQLRTEALKEGGQAKVI